LGEKDDKETLATFYKNRAAVYLKTVLFYFNSFFFLNFLKIIYYVKKGEFSKVIEDCNFGIYSKETFRFKKISSSD